MLNVSYMTLSHELDRSAIGLLRSICLISVPLPPGQVAPLFDMKIATDSNPLCCLPVRCRAQLENEQSLSTHMLNRS